MGFFCRRLPAAALRGFLNGFSSRSSCALTSSSKLLRGMYTSPRTSMNAGASVSLSGIERTVRRLAVTSSPTKPSPRVEPRTNTPSRYSRETDSPSILGSTTYTGSGTVSRTRRSNSSISSSLNTSCRLPICTVCTTLSNWLSACPPTREVGEFSACSSEYCSSSAISSCIMRSYSSSSISGSSRI